MGLGGSTAGMHHACERTRPIHSASMTREGRPHNKHFEGLKPLELSIKSLNEGRNRGVDLALRKLSIENFTKLDI